MKILFDLEFKVNLTKLMPLSKKQELYQLQFFKPIKTFPLQLNVFYTI